MILPTITVVYVINHSPTTNHGPASVVGVSNLHNFRPIVVAEPGKRVVIIRDILCVYQY